MLFGLLLIYFPVAMTMKIAAPAPDLKVTSFPMIYNNTASNHSIASSLEHSSLSNSTINSSNPPPNPWVRETSAGGWVVLSDYGSARRLDPNQRRVGVEDILSRAEAEVVRRTPSSLVPSILYYSNEYAFFYMKPVLPEVTWSIWSAALQQILYFHRNWNDITFYFRIIQPPGLGPGSMTRVVAIGQLRVKDSPAMGPR